MPAQAATVASIRQVAQRIVATPLEQLLVNPLWSGLDFKPAEAELRLVYSLAEYIIDLPIELVHQGTVESWFQQIQQADAIIDRVRKFSVLDGGVPLQQRDEIVTQVKGAAENLLGSIQGWIGFLAYQRGDVQTNILSLREGVEQAKGILDYADKYVADKRKEVEEIVRVTREASAKAGVAVFTADFKDQATDLEGSARGWLKATGAMAAATIVVALVTAFVWHVGKDDPNAQVVHLMTSKVLVLIVLLTATVWCGRIYKALMHQVAVNRHRANSLMTFQAFVQAASDDATRNAVLLETTRSIFAIAPSGYLETNDPGADTGSKVLEVIKQPSSS